MDAAVIAFVATYVLSKRARRTDFDKARDAYSSRRAQLEAELAKARSSS